MPIGPRATTGSSSTQVQAAPAGLSSSQILAILQDHPDAVTELKSYVADRMTQAGTPTEDSDISDEVLFEQVRTNPGLRAGITTFLQARGYVSDADLLSAQRAQLQEYEEVGRADEDLSGGASAAALRTRPQTPSVNAGTGPLTADMQLMQSRQLASTRKMTTKLPDREQPVHSSTEEQQVLRRPAPYNLRSMRDLYVQIPGTDRPLKRFGSEMFVNRDTEDTNESENVPLDVPLGPDYVLGAGDVLSIDVWGSSTQTLLRTVDRDGRILLPEAGALSVAGLRLGEAQGLVEAAMKRQFREARVAVTVSRLRSVRIYVVGDVQRPGGYNVSSLATPLSALYTAGGPTAGGSLRLLRHMRGTQLVEEVDLYDFLLHGIRNGTAHFESGDTLLVPPVGPQIAVSGAVRRPAIYELKTTQASLAEVLDDAGGLTVSASLEHIAIDRITANKGRETLNPTANEQNEAQSREAIAKFAVQDGDRVSIAPIAPYSERAIYVEGHVMRPGRLPYVDGMRISDVLHSSQDLLPEPAARGEIVRLMAPDMHAETLDFSLGDVLIGNADMPLQPFDTIRVFGRYEADPPKVTISGEVLRPGVFPLSKNMTAAQLVRVAGGFKRDALLESADLTSYTVIDGKRVVSNLKTVHIGAAVSGSETGADVVLKPGDILTVHQVTGWHDIGESVTVEGQVAYPGNYGLRDGERLSSVLLRAGGFVATAYPEGTVLVREEVRELEEKSRQELIRQIETSSAAARMSPNLGSSDASAMLQVINSQQDQILSRLKSQPASGRLVVRIKADINSWANTPADIELRRGDVVTIPKRPGFVLVTGQVYNPTALTFTPGKTAGWYLAHAGGTNSTANRKEVFVIRANGSILGRRSGHWPEDDVLSTKLNPGDVVVVPQKILGTSLFWRNLLTTAQLASSISITAAVAAL